MSTKEYVYVAVYDHEYGTDTHVFNTLEGAKAWCDEVANEYWDSAFCPEERPATDIGNEYFTRMEEGRCAYNESFFIRKCEVQNG